MQETVKECNISDFVTKVNELLNKGYQLLNGGLKFVVGTVGSGNSTQAKMTKPMYIQELVKSPKELTGKLCYEVIVGNNEEEIKNEANKLLKKGFSATEGIQIITVNAGVSPKDSELISRYAQSFVKTI